MRYFWLTVAIVALGGCNESRNKSIELMNQGVQKFQNRLFESAEKDLQAAIQTDPQNVLAHYNLGKVYEEQHKWNEAADEFSKAVSGDDGNENYHYDLGYAYQQVGKLDLAEKELQSAVRIKDKHFKAWYRLGTIYEAQDKPKQADDMYRKAIGINPRFAMAFTQLGFLYLNNDYIKEAEQVFQNATVANDRDGDSWYGLGLARKELGNFDGAIDGFKKAIEYGAQSPDLKYNYALALHAKGDDTNAKLVLQQFVTGAGQKAGQDLVKAANDLLYTLP